MFQAVAGLLEEAGQPLQDVMGGITGDATSSRYLIMQKGLIEGVVERLTKKMITEVGNKLQAP
jgi:hypothetical protein